MSENPIEELRRRTAASERRIRKLAAMPDPGPWANLKATLVGLSVIAGIVGGAWLMLQFEWLVWVLVAAGVMVLAWMMGMVLLGYVRTSV